MKLHALGLPVPEVDHPNKLPFEGVLTLVDVASDRAPSGARGHRVVLTRAAASEALPSLLGMAVDCKPNWDGHDVERKCGIITNAKIDGNKLNIEGFLFCKDFPGLEADISSHGPEILGMSYEIADARVEDVAARVWILNKATFTGAAILYKKKAAYQGTSFRLRRRHHIRTRTHS